MKKCGKMAGLGKYCMGGYGRIGVYRVNLNDRLELCFKDRQHRMAADLQYSHLSLTYVLPFLYKDVYYILLE